MIAPTPREALARAIYLLPVPGVRRTDAMFVRDWAWMLNPKNEAYVADSSIGQAARKADAILGLLEREGFDVVRKS